jgi:hypothetical protein
MRLVGGDERFVATPAKSVAVIAAEIAEVAEFGHGV